VRPAALLFIDVPGISGRFRFHEPGRPGQGRPLTGGRSLHALFPPGVIAHLQSAFMTVIWPKVQSHGRVSFRHLRCWHRKQDAISEMVALCWKWHLRLAAKGRDACEYPTALASYAARAVRCGRKLAGMDKAKDAMSPLAQQQYGFCVSALPDGSSLHGNAFDLALIDNRVSPVPDQVSFRVDFRGWLATRTDRDRRIIHDMMLNERTLDLADKYGISPGRVSQLRRQYMEDWFKFCGDAVNVV
jgi:hypothetical protein